ncbi:MAG TPA: DUF3237 domain-containing protein [Sphingobium sp.]|jgi:hypothetical protein|uniref:DUF3237 family protein n=1 Tax=unclassified Sphingobium TaxID=2611147 RepID=UPI000EDF2154|nr:MULTISPECIES: DUF3237 family protein [unclassified Sphingobium]WIW91015.1 DUF3237 family protein [Sphingobium sp. V4]HAF42780.1 DUF3237 domain-containing protein [Sphingobium sp.]
MMMDLNRRAFLTGGGAVFAGWTLGATALAAGVDEPGLEFVYEAIVTLEPTVEVGRTPLGTRRRVPITGGSFSGPRIRGKVLAGGADWQLQRADDWTVIEADYMMQADDGTQIHVRNVGLTNSRVPGAAQRYLRTIPSFEVPDGPHAWLNQAIFVGTLGPPPADAPKPSVRIRVYRVT